MPEPSEIEQIITYLLRVFDIPRKLTKKHPWDRTCRSVIKGIFVADGCNLISDVLLRAFKVCYCKLDELCESYHVLLLEAS